MHAVKARADASHTTRGRDCRLEYQLNDGHASVSLSHPLGRLVHVDGTLRTIAELVRPGAPDSQRGYKASGRSARRWMLLDTAFSERKASTLSTTLPSKERSGTMPGRHPWRASRSSESDWTRSITPSPPSK